MKYGIGSIILATLGILFVIWYSYENAEMIREGFEYLQTQNDEEYYPTIFMPDNMNKLIALGVAIVGIYLGIKSVKNKYRIGIIGIVLSLILIILTFSSLWTYFM
jgi:hypothetical protein